MSMNIPGYRNIVDPNVKGSLGSKIPGGKFLFNNTELSHRLLDAPKPAPTPAPPTIDEAQINVAESDRLRKRRGLYANIFAGNAAAPTVGKATLGG